MVAATLRHVGAQFEDDLETDVLPAATTVDLFGQCRLLAHCQPWCGWRTCSTTIVTRNQGGSMDLGTPRTFWVGLRWDLTVLLTACG